jgi:hypothetical protein
MDSRSSGMCVATLLLATLGALPACGGCDAVPPNAVVDCNVATVIPGTAKTDILFVVDDSGSMNGAQNNLRANFQAFVDRLQASVVKNDFQIGVTTSSVDTYAQGAANPYPDTFWNPNTPADTCPAPPYPTGTTYPKGALVSVAEAPGTTGDPLKRVQSTTSPPRILSVNSSTLVADFTSNAFVGVCGSGKEQGLEAARLALQASSPGGANAGFLRTGARLAVIILSDDDDCSDPLHTGTSREPTACTSYAVQNYVDYFNGPIDGETRPLVLGLVIAVDPTTLQPAACIEPSGNAAEHPALRYRAFADQFGSNVYVDSICKTNFHDTLVQIASLIDPGQVLPLSGEPPDWRLMAVTVVRADGSRLGCQVAPAGTAGAEVQYLAPTATEPPRLQFGGTCTLQQGDQVEINIACAG